MTAKHNETLEGQSSRASSNISSSFCSQPQRAKGASLTIMTTLYNAQNSDVNEPSAEEINSRAYVEEDGDSERSVKEWIALLDSVKGHGTGLLSAVSHPGEPRLDRDYRYEAHQILKGFWAARNKKGSRMEAGFAYWLCFKAVYRTLRVNTRTQRYEVDGRTRTMKDLKYDLDMCLGSTRALDVPSLMSMVESEICFPKFDPIKEWLEKLPKPTDDDRKLFDTFAAISLSTADPMHQKWLERYMVGAVRRVMEPGCQHRFVLTLKGSQSVGKTNFFRFLFGEEHFYTEKEQRSYADLVREYQSKWCVEFGEMDGMTRRTDAEPLKAKISETVDTLVPKFQNEPIEYPRRFIYAGTTNSASFLVDASGSTRFVIIDIGDNKIELDFIKDVRDRLWAVAFERQQAGVDNNLTEEETKYSELNNKQYQVDNSFQYTLERWIEEQSSLSQVGGRGICFSLVSIMSQVLGIPLERHKSNNKAVVEALISLGYKKVQKRVGSSRIWVFRHVSEDNAIFIDIFSDGNGGFKTSSSEFLTGSALKEYQFKLRNERRDEDEDE